MRLCKHTCSPEPSLITSVISSSRVFTRSYGAPRKLISCSGPSCVQRKEHTHKPIELPSVSHAALDMLPNWERGREGGGGRGVSLIHI